MELSLSYFVHVKYIIAFVNRCWVWLHFEQSGHDLDFVWIYWVGIGIPEDPQVAFKLDLNRGLRGFMDARLQSIRDLETALALNNLRTAFLLGWSPPKTAEHFAWRCSFECCSKLTKPICICPLTIAGFQLARDSCCLVWHVWHQFVERWVCPQSSSSCSLLFQV